MRGHGSLQQLLGKRIIGKKQKPDEQPGKRQNQSKVAPAAAAGQQTKLFNFWGSVTQPVPNAKEPDPERSNPSSLFNGDTKYSAELKPGLPSFTVYTKVVGGRYQSAEQPPLSKEQEVQLVREPSNPVDPNAILVCSCGASGAMRPHGHLPASVSAHLAGLLDAHLVEITTQQVSTLDSISSNEPHGGTNTSSSMSASSTGVGNLGNGQLISQLKLTIALTASGQQAGVRDIASTIDLAASAGLESLEAGKQNGAVLAASFDHILQQTWVHDLHLLNGDEQMVLQEIQRLPGQARALLLRLLLRKRRWFQLSGLSYADVPDPNAAAQQLARAGFVMWSHDELAPLDSLLQELPVAVLKPVLAALLPRNHPAIASASAHSTQKEALISSIQASASRTRLQAAINASAGVWLTLLPAVTETFNRMQRLYFISPGQDLGMFVAVDRGVLRYPTYSIRRTSPVFPNRRALLEYEQALQLAAQVEEALEAGDSHAAWHLMQPALAALQVGVHKAIQWEESHGPMPNSPPAPADLQQPQQQHQQQQQAWHQGLQQLIMHQHVQILDEQQEEQQPDSPFARELSRSPSPREPFSPGMMAVKGRSRSRTPSPSSSSPAGADGDSESESSSNSSSSHSSRTSTTQSSLNSRSQSTSSATTPVITSRTIAAATAEITADLAGMQPASAQTLQHSQDFAAEEAASKSQPLFFARFCAGWVYASLGTVAASLLEKQKRWSEATEVLRLLLGGNACVTRRGDWWTRLAINLEHQGLVEQALEAVEASLADSWVRGGDLLGLQRRLLRLGKPPRRWKRPAWSRQAEWEPPELAITGRPLNCTTGAKSRFYGLDGSQVSVEELALQHYATPEGGGWQGLHSEGGVWATLFGLLMWDVLFEDVADVFRSPFQVAPLDLDCDTFYPARRSSIDMQLSRIADGQAAEILSASWSAHCGVMCRGVNWARFSKQQLLDICACVGGLGLAAVLRLMAEDHSGAQGGLPDLLLWRMADHSVKMVEVKGPRDRLSHQQRFWLAHMANSTIQGVGFFMWWLLQVEVCKVKEPQGLPSRSSARSTGSMAMAT